MTLPIEWSEARKLVYEAGRAAQLPASRQPLSEADGLTLAQPLSPATDLPAFATSSVDGWALRGTGPWQVTGRALAGNVAMPLTADATAMEIATGAMVPEGTEAILRVEHSSLAAGVVTGDPKGGREWREPGEEAQAGEVLLPAGTLVTPGVIGLAASCGLDTLPVTRAPRVALLVFGDELLTSGPPGAGRVRDALGPSIPAYLQRLGAQVIRVIGPIKDTLAAHVAALTEALDADVICTTGGTMHGPVDHLHPALEQLRATYVVNTVAVRPGFPMLIAAIPAPAPTPRTVFVAGLPGNPQSAVVALVSLVVPLLAGLTGAAAPPLRPVTLGAPVPGRGDYTHLALVRRHGIAHIPVSHAGSAMLRGLAAADGFAVIPPHGHGLPGRQADFLELP